MVEGYIRLWRKLRDNPVFQDPLALSIFIYCLNYAEWRDGRKVIFNKREATLRRGQLTAGRYQISKSCGIKPSSVRNALERLVSAYHILELQPSPKTSLITVINWDKYQVTEDAGQKVTVKLEVSKSEKKDSSEDKLKPPFPGLFEDRREDNGRTAGGQLEDTPEEYRIKNTRINALKDSNPKKKKISHLSDREFIDYLKTNAAYEGINIDIELSRMDAWLLVHPQRKKTRRFIVNWLNKYDKEIKTERSHLTPQQIRNLEGLRRFHDEHAGL